MMTKAVSVDKSDILMIKDLECGMRTVARNIINKEEWVPCKILAKFGAFRDLDLSDDSNRKLYATRCGYRVEYIDTNDNSIITMVSLSDCAMELADLPPDILKEFKGLENQISNTTDCNWYEQGPFDANFLIFLFDILLTLRLLGLPALFFRQS